MGFIKSIKSVIQKQLGTTPASTNPNKLLAAEANIPRERQEHPLHQTPRPAVQLPIDQIPQTLADAIVYVRMSEPIDIYDQITWHNICGQLRNQYKTQALQQLRRLLQAINSNSLAQTENAIDDALLKLQTLVPVVWVLERKHLKNLPDGSRSYRLIGHWAKINPSGAFAITDLNHKTWIAQASAIGTAFISPE